MVTRRDLFLRARAAIPVENAAFEARELLYSALRISKEDYYLSPSAPVTDADAVRFLAMLESRLKGEPLAYVLGEWDFYGRTFTVTPDVLIPRPETEDVVRAALSFLAGGETVLDLCSGSGAIGITMALEKPGLSVTLGELSDAAIAVSEENIRKLGAEHVTVRKEDALLPPSDPNERFDMIVSNPPYIAPNEPLEDEVRDFEPAMALFGGEDGLEFYRAFAAHRLASLCAGGHIVMECGEKQAHAVEAIFLSAGARETHILRDLSGKARVVIAGI